MGVKVNCVDFHNKTPLHYAAKTGNIEIGKLLIQLGAELNILDYKGRTSAGLAEDKEHFNFADTLEKLGGKKLKSYDMVNKEQNDKYSLNVVEKINEELSKDLMEADKRYKKILL